MLTLATQIAERNASIEEQKAVLEFGGLVRFLLHHRKFSEACFAARQGAKLHAVAGLSPRTLALLRAYSDSTDVGRFNVTKAAATLNTLAGGAFQDAGIIPSGFVNSLAHGGVFDRLLPDMAQIPLVSGTIGAINVGATAYQINEGHMKPISKLSLSGAQQNPQKAHVAVIITQELARSSGPLGATLIVRELQNALRVATDGAFLLNIISGITTVPSNGTTATQVRNDIDYMMRQIPFGSVSKPVIITTPEIVETWSMMSSGAVSCFPELTPLGGTINGIPILPCTGCPVGMVIMADASQLAAASGDIILEEIHDGLVQMDDAPDSPPVAGTTMVSLWENNLTGLRAERWWIGQRLKANAVSVLTNSNSYSGGGSPP